MSRKNPDHDLTLKHGLRQCSMGRCCNIHKYIETLTELEKLKQQLSSAGLTIHNITDELEEYGQHMERIRSTYE